MKIIIQLKAQLEKIGARLDERSEYDLYCDAPSGYVWRANGCCTIAIQCASNSQSWYAKAIDEAIRNRLKMGLTKVVDPREIKRIRFELDDDSWGADASAPGRIEWRADLSS